MIFKYKILSVLSLLGITVNIVACSGNADKTTTGSNSAASINPTVGVVDKDAMYVKVYSSGQFLYTLTNHDTPTSDCSISSTAAKQYIDCDLRMNELDVVAAPISLMVNIPPGMCTYMEVLPYYFYNFEAGKLTSKVTIDLQPPTPTCTTNVPAFTTSFSTTDGVTYCDVKRGATELFSVNTETGAITTHRFDYSADDGPNCATGEIKGTITKADGTAGPEISKTYSGKYVNCLAGPAMELMKTEWPKTADGYPYTTITYAANGQNSLFEMKSPLDIGKSNSMNIANEFSSSIPVIFDAPYRSTASGAHPYYYWGCYDSNGEEKYRIRLKIVEYNTLTEFLKWYNSNKSNSSIGDKDLSSNCDYVSGTLETCNDYADIDDLIGTFPQENSAK